MLRTRPLAERVALIGEWNNKFLPRTASYFADFVTNRVPGAKERAYEELLARARRARDEKFAKLSRS